MAGYAGYGSRNHVSDSPLTIRKPSMADARDCAGTARGLSPAARLDRASALLYPAPRPEFARRRRARRRRFAAACDAMLGGARGPRCGGPYGAAIATRYDLPAV